jgi:hypothetical protein
MEDITKYEAYYSIKNGLNFKCGCKHCWEVKNGYQTAELQMDGHFVNHQIFTNLEDALLRLRK